MSLRVAMYYFLFSRSSRVVPPRGGWSFYLLVRLMPRGRGLGADNQGVNFVTVGFDDSPVVKPTPALNRAGPLVTFEVLDSGPVVVSLPLHVVAPFRAFLASTPIRSATTRAAANLGKLPRC